MSKMSDLDQWMQETTSAPSKTFLTNLPPLMLPWEELDQEMGVEEWPIEDVDMDVPTREADHEM